MTMMSGMMTKDKVPVEAGILFTGENVNCIIDVSKLQTEEKTMQFTDELFKIFVEQLGDTVYRYAVIHLKSEAEAQDVYQEVFLKLYEKQPEFESMEHAKAWLLRVCINMCKNKLRYSFMHSHKELDERVNNIADKTSENENQVDIVHYLKQLPEKYSRIIYLYYYEEYKSAEIAEICEMKESTVRSLLKRGREKLKEILVKEGISNG